LDAEDVVVASEHVHVGRIARGVLDNLDLGIVNAREVAGASGLMFLGLKRERIRIDTGHRGTSVVVVGLDLVEVLALLLLETILAVEDELEGVQRTDSILSELRGTTGETSGNEGRTHERRSNEAVSLGSEGGALENDTGIGGNIGEVPKGVLVGGNVGEAPYELLDGVVVGEAHLLGTIGGNGVSASVLNLLNEVLVSFLGKTPTLLSVEVNVISPNLEGVSVKEGGEVGREVEIDAHLMVL